ncbi:MAG: phosphoribosylformylglycinamidine synthase subunit PurS, partial [Planctomycetia bacterium]|nr:phosphoribosylformylglycinamidine synthase subunit PurS [Planctomycetia bacterium]
MLWEIDIAPRAGLPNRAAEAVAAAAADLGLRDLKLSASPGYLVQGDISRAQIERIAAALLVDGVVEESLIAPVGDPALAVSPAQLPQLVYVLPKPGVMDPVAQSAIDAAADLGLPVETVRTLKKYWLPQLNETSLSLIARKILANDAIEQVIVGPLPFTRLEIGRPGQFELRHVPIRELSDADLVRLSREGQLYLQPAEMQAIRAYYRELGREPTDAELESLAQTWSEHC